MMISKESNKSEIYLPMATSSLNPSQFEFGAVNRHGESNLFENINIDPSRCVDGNMEKNEEVVPFLELRQAGCLENTAKREKEYIVNIRDCQINVYQPEYSTYGIL